MHGSVPARPAISALAVPSTPEKPREFFVQGLTQDGRAFRPRDWAERLASAMAWDFVMNFARDNELQLGRVCVLPDVPSAQK